MKEGKKKTVIVLLPVIFLRNLEIFPQVQGGLGLYMLTDFLKNTPYKGE